MTPTLSHRLDQAGRWMRNAAESLSTVVAAHTSPLAGRLRLERASEPGSVRAVPSAALVEPPRVVLDAVFFQLQTTGIAHMWSALMQQWSESEFAPHLVVLDRGGTAPRLPGFTYREMPELRHYDSSAQRFALQAVCDSEHADVLLSTYYTTGTSTPSIMCAYDMIPEVMGFDLHAPMWRDKRRAIEHAGAFVAISQCTADDLIRFYPTAEEHPLLVAHCAADPLFEPAPPAEVARVLGELGLPDAYVVFVGDRDAPQKNAALAIKALAAIDPAGRPALLCVGGAPELEPHLASLAGSANVRVAALDNVRLRAAYTGARALLYPSLYEGFGLPILEAMACGCPVITCPVSAMPEVAGDAARFVSTDDADELARAIVELADPTVRERFRDLGLARACDFDWGATAARVAAFVTRFAAGR